MSTKQSVLDMDVLDEAAEFGVDDLGELIEMYLVQATEIVNELYRAIEAGAADAVNELAHKLASSSATCGATAAVGPLRSLEQLGRDGNLADAQQLLDLVTDRIEICERLLGDYLKDRGFSLRVSFSNRTSAGNRCR